MRVCEGGRDQRKISECVALRKNLCVGSHPRGNLFPEFGLVAVLLPEVTSKLKLFKKDSLSVLPFVFVPSSS